MSKLVWIALIAANIVQSVYSVGFQIPKHLLGNSSISPFEKRARIVEIGRIESTDRAMKEATIVVSAGCFLFISLAGGIWIWLALRRWASSPQIRRRSTPKFQVNQVESSSPLRSPRRTQRIFFSEEFSSSAPILV